jgi:hypothetical protein
VYNDLKSTGEISMTTRLPERVYVLAINHAHYRHFRRALVQLMIDSGVDFSFRDIEYIGSVDGLHGIWRPWGYAIKGWQKCRHSEQIAEMIATRGSNVRDDFIEVDLDFFLQRSK